MKWSIPIRRRTDGRANRCPECGQPSGIGVCSCGLPVRPVVIDDTPQQTADRAENLAIRRYRMLQVLRTDELSGPSA